MISASSAEAFIVTAFASSRDRSAWLSRVRRRVVGVLSALLASFSGETVMAQVHPEMEPDARIAAHEGIQEYIHDLAPLGWIGEHYFAVGLSRKVSGFRWYTTQYYHVNEMSIAE